MRSLSLWGKRCQRSSINHGGGIRQIVVANFRDDTVILAKP
jgi:hypothetical protein